MTGFWIVAAGMVLVALGALLPTLLRHREMAPGTLSDATLGVYRERLAELRRERDRGQLSDTEFADAQTELEREVLADVSGDDRPARADVGRSWPAGVAVAVFVPVVALLLYAATGQPGLLGGSGADRLSPEQIERLSTMSATEMIDTLERHVQAHPAAPRAWALLGQVYRARERYGDAADAFRRAREAGGNRDAWLIAYQAESTLLANGRRFTSGVERLLDEALAVDPRNQLALMLAGHAAFSDGDNARAARYWETLANTMPEGDEQRAIVEGLVAQARGEQAGAADRASGPTGDPSDGARVTVRVRLAETMIGQAPPGAPVFVFARRAGSGGGPPLAVTRTTVESLPAEIALTDAQSMMEGNRLSQAERVVITARVSTGGGVRPQSGDLEGNSDPVAVGERVEVVIDRRLP